MMRWVVVLDGRVMGVVYDDTHQWLFGSCVKFSQTAVVVWKDSVRCTKQSQKWEDSSSVHLWGGTGWYCCQL